MKRVGRFCRLDVYKRQGNDRRRDNKKADGFLQHHCGKGCLLYTSALNNKEGVSKAVKQEILNVANEMGYTARFT